MRIFASFISRHVTCVIVSHFRFTASNFNTRARVLPRRKKWKRERERKTHKAKESKKSKTAGPLKYTPRCYSVRRHDRHDRPSTTTKISLNKVVLIVILCLFTIFTINFPSEPSSDCASPWSLRVCVCVCEWVRINGCERIESSRIDSQINLYPSYVVIKMFFLNVAIN